MFRETRRMGRGFHGAWSTEGLRGILSATKDATDVGCGLGIAAWSGIFRGASQCSARGFGPGGLEVPGPFSTGTVTMAYYGFPWASFVVGGLLAGPAWLRMLYKDHPVPLTVPWQFGSLVLRISENNSSLRIQEKNAGWIGTRNGEAWDFSKKNVV